MYPHVCYVFIDGSYLRKLAHDWGLGALEPRRLSTVLVNTDAVQGWAQDPRGANSLLGRITYYDAMPDDASDRSRELEEYWRAIELLPDVHLGFGALKGLKRRARQKGVDVLLAVDMLAGAFGGGFDVAVLVAGDADFIPVVEEVKRRGVMVAVAAAKNSISEDLRRSADRFLEIPEKAQWLKPIPRSDGSSFDPWPVKSSGADDAATT